MSAYDKLRARIEKMSEERRDFITLEDGYIYYWPSGQGALNAADLRILADILDTKNAAWNEEVHNMEVTKDKK